MAGALGNFLEQGMVAVPTVSLPGDPGELPSVDEKPLFIVDLEMSGPNPRMHEVLDIGWVVASTTDGLREQSSWGSRVRPRHIGNAELGALKVVGYSPRDWRDAIELEEAVRQMAAHGAGTVLAGWGIRQDLEFVDEILQRAAIPWPFAVAALDVQLIARKVLGAETVERFNLGHVADRLGIGRMGEHGALPDAFATFDILVELARRAGHATSGHAH